MTVVFDVLRDALNKPVPGVRVTVELEHGDVTAIGPDGVIVSPAPIVTDPAGRWEADLVPNDEITPAGTYYSITGRLAGLGVVSSKIVVPVSDAPLRASTLLVESIPARQPAVPVGYLTDTGGFITGQVYVGEVPPPNPRLGTLWVSTTETV